MVETIARDGRLKCDRRGRGLTTRSICVGPFGQASRGPDSREPNQREDQRDDDDLRAAETPGMIIATRVTHRSLRSSPITFGQPRESVAYPADSRHLHTDRALFVPMPPGSNKRIVIIDDDLSVQQVTRAYLERDGYSVYVASSAGEGLGLAERVKPGLVVLDLMLPDRPGEDVCREIRERSDVPILMLTAKASEDSRVSGLALGADDYLTKPFSPRELVGRIRAVLRRVQAQLPLVEILSFDDGALEIDTVRYEVRRDGEPVELTPREFKLLQTLARYPGRVYSRTELIDQVQGYDYRGFERTIDAHVKNLRKKIEPDPRRPRYVETVVGSGYRLRRARA